MPFESAQDYHQTISNNLKKQICLIMNFLKKS